MKKFLSYSPKMINKQNIIIFSKVYFRFLTFLCDSNISLCLSLFSAALSAEISIPSYLLLLSYLFHPNHPLLPLLVLPLLHQTLLLLLQLDQPLHHSLLHLLLLQMRNQAILLDIALLRRNLNSRSLRLLLHPLHSHLIEPNQ